MRRLDSRDTENLWELEKSCFSLPWSADQLRGAFAQPAFSALGVCAGSSILAYLSCYRAADELEILNLATSPGCRRQGHARLLLELLLHEAAKMGMQKIWLEVRQGNGAAISLYESCGFRRAGRRPRYYPDTGEDALVYGLDPLSRRSFSCKKS